MYHVRHEVYCEELGFEPVRADRLGVDIRQIGGPVEHRGTRVPSMMDVDSIIKNMRFLVKPIWRVIQEEIENGFAQAGSSRSGVSRE